MIDTSSPEAALASFVALLHELARRNASDIYFTAGSPPMLRIEGVVQPCDETALKPADIEAIAQAIMGPARWQEYLSQWEMNFALPTALFPTARFRVNVFRQRGSSGIVLRRISIEIPNIDELKLPQVLKEVVLCKRGLVLIVGPTDSGKSTTLAAMIDHRNANRPGHIISIEDPIEFTHRHQQSIITQREIGFDTHTYHDALKNAMRQAPDMIVLGEIRDAETMEAAIAFADTGHLCAATLHATNANQALERVINFFPIARHPEMYLQLALNLLMIVSQRLLMGTDGKRVAAVEVMLNRPRIKDLIKKGQVDMLKQAMEESALDGCQTFDMALYDLYKAEKISLEHALCNADSANNLRLKIKLSGGYIGEADGDSAEATLRIQSDNAFADWR